MVRDLHLTVSAFFCCAVIAYSLKCQYCEREEPNIGCRYPGNVCYTGPQGLCTSISVYFKEELKYRMEGCTKHVRYCRKDKNYRTGHCMAVFCCRYDLCNHWEKDVS